jgi:hypothetical protein
MNLIKKIQAVLILPCSFTVAFNAVAGDPAAPDLSPVSTPYYGTTGYQSGGAILPSAAATAALSDQMEALNAVTVGLTNTLVGINAASNAGQVVSSVAADGTKGYRKDLLADATFSSTNFQTAEISIDGSIYLKTSSNMLSAIADKEIVLLAAWSDDGSDVAGLANGPDFADHTKGHECMTTILPDPLPLNADGSTQTAAEMEGPTVGLAQQMLGSECRFALQTTIDTIKALHDDDVLADAGGFCTVFQADGSSQGGCP